VALQPLSELPAHPLEIKRALISVSDKSGLIPLAETLHNANIELISTGGTAKKIKESNIPVRDVSELTGVEEFLDGRVKTLHPHIYGGILARTSHQPDINEIEKLGIEPVELVVVNLYPFSKSVNRPDCTPSIATENIDIGGPTMIRAAAKNFAHVCILTDPSQYKKFIKELNNNKKISIDFRRELGREAFNHTARYDAHIANYFNDVLMKDENPFQINISLSKSNNLRYGENPHQKAAVYGNQNEFIDCFHGKQLSYNNLLDIDSAIRLAGDFEDDDPTCAIFKHTVPCGVATDVTLVKAWNKAFSTDTMSPFGGIVIVNKELDYKTAEAIDNIFTEIIIAPSFSEQALQLLQKKEKRRLIRLKKPVTTSAPDRQFRSIFGGGLSQESDNMPIHFADFETVTDREPTQKEIRDLFFAWKVVKHVKSNAIVYASNGQTIGIGTGQTSRVEASKTAVAKAKQEGLSLENTAIASDAFFPFADGVEAAANAGATCVIQPGGSIRDEEVINAANKHDMAMLFTHTRHFRH